MSFMYESMISRAPGKRKIKVQEKNLLELMQEDDDDEEDEDFQVNHEQEKENVESNDSSDDSCATSSEDSSSTESASASDQESSVRRNSSAAAPTTRTRHVSRKQSFAPLTIQSTNAFIHSQKNSEPTSEILAKAKRQFELSTIAVSKNVDSGDIKICCVCLKNRNPNDVVSCSLCAISVHKDCYGGNLTISHQCSAASTRWFCAACINGLSPNCEFCPNDFGCLKESSNGQWCHIVCARYIGGQEMLQNNSHSNQLIDMSSLNYKQYGLHECVLCEDFLVAKTALQVCRRLRIVIDLAIYADLPIA